MSSLISSTDDLEKLREEGGVALYRGATRADGSSLLTAITPNVIDDGRRRLEHEFAQRDLLHTHSIRHAARLMVAAAGCSASFTCNLVGLAAQHRR
jgi:hypothetical protein